MARSRFHALLLAAILLSPLLVLACSSSSPEQQILTNFFRAARLRDNTTLANIAAVSFDPRTDGSVQRFSIVKVSPEQHRALPIKALSAEAEKAKADDEDLARRKKAYEDENLPALQRIAKAQQAGQILKGRDVELLAEWTKWASDERQSQRHLTDVRTRLASERAAAISSLTPPGQADIDVSNMSVDLITEQLTVDAQVRTPDGRTTARTIVFTMQRAVGKDGNKVREGRWIVSGLQLAPAARPA